MRDNSTPFINISGLRAKEPFVYTLARWIGYPFRYEVVGLENIQSPGPALFISNHLGAVGPLAVMISLPIRFQPWIVSEMMDFERSPQYLFDDFVHPVLHLDGRFGLFVSTMITKLSVRLLHAIEAVSIDRFGGLSIEGFRQSLYFLRKGRNLLIFPEDPLQPMDEQTLMRRFMPGFASLCHMYQVEQHQLLPVYLLAVHQHSAKVSIGSPEYLSFHTNHKQAINAFTQFLQQRVRNLYLGLIEQDGDLEL